jgi:hypothetical protein
MADQNTHRWRVIIESYNYAARNQDGHAILINSTNYGFSVMGFIRTDCMSIGLQ